MDVVLLIGRILFAALFISSGVSFHLLGEKMATGYAQAKGVPMARLAVVGSGVLIIVGGLMILFGIWADLGALFIAIFLLPTAVLMHGFWRETDQQSRMMEMVAVQQGHRPARRRADDLRLLCQVRRRPRAAHHRLGLHGGLIFERGRGGGVLRGFPGAEPPGGMTDSGPVGAQILDGRAAAAAIKADLRERVERLGARGVHPGLGTVLVGDDPGSRAYVAGKHRDTAEVGITSIRVDLPVDATQEQVEQAVRELNANPECTGYIVQLPLPRGLDANQVLEIVDPHKDADGLHPTNLGKLVLGQQAPLPCTPRGIVDLLQRHDVPIAGAEVCIIGRGVTVGRPLGLLLTRRQENATVTLCHTGTRDIAAHVRRADIVVAAAGVPGLVTGAMVKPGAAVLDVGITRTDEGLVGDVHPSTYEVAAWVAPMPGGVGPMTRAMLLTNVVEAAEQAVESLANV